MEPIQQIVFPTYLPDLSNPFQLGPHSRFALGTAGLGGMWGKVSTDEAQDTILMALSEGVEVFDTAPAYGHAEEILGRVLSKWRGEQPFLSTKVGRLRGENALDAKYDYATKSMHQSIMNSLEKLERKAIDLLFLHDPINVPVEERARVWGDMEAFRKEGLATFIGLGGKLDEHWYSFLKRGKVDAIMEYNNLDAVNLSSMNETVPVCLREKIFRYQGSPLHNGLLGRRYDEFTLERPDWIPLEDIDQAARLKTISQKFDIPLDQLALRFILSIGEVGRVVTGPSNMKELSSTLKAWKKGHLSIARFYEICNGLI